MKILTLMIILIPYLNGWSYSPPDKSFGIWLRTTISTADSSSHIVNNSKFLYDYFSFNQIKFDNYDNRYIMDLTCENFGDSLDCNIGKTELKDTCTSISYNLINFGIQVKRMQMLKNNVIQLFGSIYGREIMIELFGKEFEIKKGKIYLLKNGAYSQIGNMDQNGLKTNKCEK